MRIAELAFCVLPAGRVWPYHWLDIPWPHNVYIRIRSLDVYQWYIALLIRYLDRVGVSTGTGSEPPCL